MEWLKTTLGKVCDVRDGTHDSPKYQESGYPLVTSKNLKNGEITLDKIKYISESDFTKINQRSAVHIGDVLFAMIGTIGNPVVIKHPPNFAIKNVALFKAREECDSQFLKYYLESPYVIEKMESEAKGTTQKFVGLGYLRQFPVTIPPIPEQKRIVAILDQAFADIEQARAKTEQNLRNARELFESYLQQIFSQHGEGWVEKGLKDVSLEFGRGKSKHRPRNDESLYGGDYPFIQTGDVRNCEHLITNYSKTYNDKGLAQSKLWPKGTICITIAANIAETGILDFEGCFPDSVIGVVVNPAVTTVRYVEYLLQSFKTILKAKGQGSAQDNINMGTFEKIIFPFPTSIEVQNDIVNSLNGIMNSVQQLERIYSDKLNTIDELKKSILQKAFSGELTKTLEVNANKGAMT